MLPPFDFFFSDNFFCFSLSLFFFPFLCCCFNSGLLLSLCLYIFTFILFFFFLSSSSSSKSSIVTTLTAAIFDSSSASISSRFFCRPMAFFDWLSPWDVRELYIRKTADLPSNSGSAYFHVSWLFDFIFYQKPLYKSLHQSFLYSFITILLLESGVTLHYSTIFP